MTANEEKEICREFKEAKDKAEQIDIIAQLRCIERGKVVEVLKKYGFDVPRKKWSRKSKEPETKTENPEHQMPDVVRETIAEKMDKIDQKIKELEPIKREYDELQSQYGLLAQYLCS